MKIIQITDTHFSESKRHFLGNWAPLCAWIEEQEADLVVHTGDLTVDGADDEQELRFSMELMRQVRVPMLLVPGNHDVGHLPGTLQPVTPDRLRRWETHVGPDRWIEDTTGWRLIGFNTLLIGHGNEAENRQLEWLSEAIATAAGRRIALFTHKPLFVDDPLEGDTDYWGIRPRERRRIFDAMAGNDVALVASGHLHWAWQGTLGATALTWGPSAAFVIDKLEREMPGRRVVGAVVHDLGDGVESRIVAVPGMMAHVFDEVFHEVYPMLATAKEAAR
ncbi:metallophosphoesterase [Rhizobium sp. TRM95111]|uniref:metallophosphoesterase family protein n=1 Tax=Rhizobium alarense TaxID=2846851 RepID=UPI001F35F056|nr:metallophosphoesterase [Rhizobium alarense]MCF3639281.1 metallophosphoesterase [Rhizobium alarense]